MKSADCREREGLLETPIFLERFPRQIAGDFLRTVFEKLERKKETSLDNALASTLFKDKQLPTQMAKLFINAKQR